MGKYNVDDILDRLQHLDNRADGRLFLRKLSYLMMVYQETGRKPNVEDFGIEKIHILYNMLDDTDWVIGADAVFWQKEFFEELERHFYDERFYMDFSELGMQADAAFELKADLDAKEAVKAIWEIENYNPRLASRICEAILCPELAEYKKFNLYTLSDGDSQSIPRSIRAYFMPDSPIWSGKIRDELAERIIKAPYADTGEFYYSLPR